jgi:hypothetical protein
MYINLILWHPQGKNKTQTKTSQKNRKQKTFLLAKSLLAKQAG